MQMWELFDSCEVRLVALKLLAECLANVVDNGHRFDPRRERELEEFGICWMFVDVCSCSLATNIDTGSV